MLKTLTGTYRKGKVQLAETPPDVEEAPVLVTFLTEGNGGQPPQLTPAEIAELRGKLGAWEQDWDAPGMEAYDRP